MSALLRMLTAIAGACVEAWAEVRVHRGRVLLSLIGVGVAVAALTVVVAAGDIMQQSLREVSERQGGREATLAVSLYGGESGTDPDEARAAFASAAERYAIEWTSAVAYSTAPVRFVDGRSEVSVTSVDVPYGVMHRVELLHGEWFTERDAARMAPALIVNERMWERLGSPDLVTRPTVVLPGELDQRALVVGVTPSTSFDTAPSMYMLASQSADVVAADPYAVDDVSLQFEAWVPEGLADELTMRLTDDLRAAVGDGLQVDVARIDYAEQNAQSIDQVRLVVGGIALLVLLLGALGLVNIALVTVRARVREIGIRRTFGATASRVFFAVMMESVVATIVAGVVGVMAAILLVENPWAQDLIGQGVTEPPAFPLSAALTGLAAATAVGALAGFIPALIAVRVKVIDALRF